ncbi:MAG: nucleotidyltransferase family protein [Acidimicrobiia bacterium]|nr:nucleotidyltransferase family protein [Acidimicrobiia bacterium]
MIAALVLAAGGSRRLGRPKQLEPWGSTTLLGHVIDLVESCPVDETWVVVGSDLDRVVNEIGSRPVGIIQNPDWETGLASSLRVGLDALTQLSKADGALVFLGDQPAVRADVVTALIEKHRRSSAMAIVPKYRYSRGNPVLIDRALWPRLMSLEGDEGAQRLLQAHSEWVEEVWFDSLPPRDIDTQADVEELRPRRT